MKTKILVFLSILSLSAYLLCIPGESKMSEIIFEMIALNGSKLPEVKGLMKSLTTIGLNKKDIKKLTISKDLISFDYIDFNIIAKLIDAPISWQDIEGPCNTAWYWPDAKKSMSSHKFHLIVTLSNGSGSTISRYILLTKIISSIAKNTQTAGIYWGSATLVFSSDMFSTFSEDIDIENLPLMLWIDFRIQQREKGFILFTTGMKTFGHKEIEVKKPYKDKKELYDIVYNLAYYLLENGPVIKDGDTFGLSESQKIKIKYESSMCKNRKEKIMSLSL